MIVPYVRQQLSSIYPIGNYLVTSQVIGKGSWGTVFRGYSLTTGSLVAIKRMDFAEGSARTQDFLARECKTLKGINCININIFSISIFIPRMSLIGDPWSP